MNRILKKDLEVKVLSTEEDFKATCEYFSRDELWRKVKGNELHAIGYSDVPILAEQLIEESGVESMDAFLEGMSETGIFTQIPSLDGLHMETYAGRYTSYVSMYNRSGTNCRMITTVMPKSKIAALSAEERGKEIDRGWSTTKENLSIYIVDSKISYFGSDKYVILSYLDGFNAVKDMLKEAYPKAEYIIGQVSYEYIFGEWRLHADEEEIYKLLFKEAGKDLENISFLLRYSSSNVGNAKMAARLFLEIDDIRIPIGHSQNIWHRIDKRVEDKGDLDSDNGCEMDDFKTKLGWVGKIFKENEDLLKILAHTPILHPAGCLKQLLMECRLIPSIYRKTVIEEMDVEWGNNPCTALDVYSKASSVINFADTPTKIVLITEEIAELQFKNFLLYDKDLDE